MKIKNLFHVFACLPFLQFSNIQNKLFSESIHDSCMRKIITLIVVFFLIVSNSRAQYPYYNPGFVLGQQLGNAIGSAISQNHKYGRNKLCKQIQKWGQCKNGSLSLEHGAVAIYGDNGYYCTATVDDRLKSKLSDIHKSKKNINDINITENGYFIVLFNNGKDWFGTIPSELKQALDKYAYGTVFRSISFNESGVYAITTSGGFCSNNLDYQNFYDDNIDDFGDLLSVNISGNGAVFCYSDKVRYCGSIPSAVETAMNNFKQSANFVKFNKHGHYLICDKFGSYAYSIGAANSSNNATLVTYNYREERWKNTKEKAYEEWDGKLIPDYSENIYRLQRDSLDIDGTITSIGIYTGTTKGSAPELEFKLFSTDREDLISFANKNFQGDKFLADSTNAKISLKILLSNGETITTEETHFYSSIGSLIAAALGIFSCDIGANLIHMRSDRRSLRGDMESAKYLIEQFSYNNIKSISIGFEDKDETTIDFSSIKSKKLLCYIFSKTEEDIGQTEILPN